MHTAMASVPALNLARLPPPVKVYYPSPKDAAPQAHPGGAHLVHRSWPLPSAPPPKINPKNLQDVRILKELYQKPKAANKPPVVRVSGGCPFWWGATTHDRMQPPRHLNSTLPKAIGSDFVRAPLPPRPVIFWGTKNQEGRQARRDAAVLGVDEGQEGKMRTSSKRESWVPSKDITSNYFHASKSTYIRGSAALIKQQLVNERAAGLARPASAASERPRDGRRSASPALKRPSSACSVRSSGRKTPQRAWWTKSSWGSSSQDGLSTKLNTLKQRILDDIMQEATFVNVDDSDAYKFGGNDDYKWLDTFGGHDDYKWTEVEVIQPRKTDKKPAAKRKRKLKAKAKPTSRPTSRPSSAVPHSKAPPGPAAEQRERVSRKPSAKPEFVEIRADARARQPRPGSPPRPSDLVPHPSRIRNVSPTNVAAVMERAKSTLRHIQALKDRQLTNEEIEDMLSEYPVHVGADIYSGSSHSHASDTLREYRQDYSPCYSPAANVLPKVAIPCSLSGIDSDHDDDESQDTFEFTEDENLGGDSSARLFNNDSREHDDFQVLSSSDHSDDLAGLMSRGVGEPEGVTPKDASAFMPSRPPGYFAHGHEQGHDILPSLVHQTEHGSREQEDVREEGRGLDDQRVPGGGSDQQVREGEGPEPTNRTNSSNSSSESLQRRGTEEDSREPWRIARGPQESVAHSRVSVSKGSVRDMASGQRSGGARRIVGGSLGGTFGAWPAAAAGLFESVNNSAAHLV